MVFDAKKYKHLKALLGTLNTVRTSADESESVFNI